MALRELIYMSTMLGESEHELGAIWESSARRNQLNGVTGMLLYYGGGFIQVLEGEEAAVMETYGRICKDLRHHDVTCMSNVEVPKRHFDTWSMGFKHVSVEEIAKVPQHAQFFNFNTQAKCIKAKPGLALEMLTLFSRGMV